MPEQKPYRLSPFGLWRFALLPPCQVAATEFADIPATLRASEALRDEVRRQADLLSAKLAAKLPGLPFAKRGAVLNLMRTLRRDPLASGSKHLAPAETCPTLGPEVAEYVSALAAYEESSVAAAGALKAALAASDARLRQLCRTSPLLNALKISNPRPLQQLETAPAGERSELRALSTLRRVSWRAAGRTSPLGLLATTAVASWEEKAIEAWPEYHLEVALRPEGKSTLPSQVKTERELWVNALKDPKQLFVAITVSEVAARARRIARGDSCETLSAQEATRVAVDAALDGPVPTSLSRFRPALATLARYGSARRLRPAGRRWPALDEVWRERFAGVRTVPLKGFMDAVLAWLEDRHGPEAVRRYPLHALLGEPRQPSRLTPLIEAHFNANRERITIAEAEIDPHTEPVPVPPRVAVTCQITGTDTSCDGLAIRKLARRWSLFPRYETVIGPALPEAATTIRSWFQSFPDEAAVVWSDQALSSAPTTGRIDARTLTLSAYGEAHELCLTREADGFVLAPVSGNPVHPVHIGVESETCLPLTARVLLLIGAGAPSALEDVYDAINRAYAGVIGSSRALPATLPGCSLGNELELSPKMLFWPRDAVIDDGGGGVEWAWRILRQHGFQAELTLMQPLSGAEEIAVDLGHPDGIAFLARVAAEAGGVTLAPVRREADLHGLVHQSPIASELYLELCSRETPP